MAVDIPQDILDAALRAANAEKSDLNNDLSMVCVYIAARAIIAERERCAAICRTEGKDARSYGLHREAAGADWCASRIRKPVEA